MDTGDQPGRPIEGLVGVFVRCRSVLRRYVGRVVKPHEIDDIVQETFVRTFEASRKSPIRHPRAFMFRTAYNLAISQLRRAEGRVTTQVADFSFLDTYSEANSPESEFESSQRFLLFCEAIRNLPKQCRRAFILKRVYGFTQKEIAEKLGLTESTVEKHLCKGLSLCKSYLEARDSGFEELLGRRPRRNRLKDMGNR